MSIAKLFVKVFNEDIFEKLGETQPQPSTEEQKQQEQREQQQKGNDELKKRLVVVRESEVATTSSGDIQQHPQIPKTEDMCLPE